MQPFGHWPHRPTLSLRRPQVAVASLTEAARALVTSTQHDDTDVVLTLAAGPAGVPILIVEEHERRTVAPLDGLARQMTKARVPDTPDTLAAALTTWLHHRPASDAHAQSEGLAVLDWADPQQTRLTWRVAVRRGDLVLPWAPSDLMSVRTRERTQADAADRSHHVPASLHIEGGVALWTAADVPMLSTALLVNPDRLLADMARAGLAARDMHIVLAPRRPVACAEGGLARRLAGETGEAHSILPWAAVTDLRWV